MFRIDAKNLRVEIGNKNILDNISLSFNSGELIGVLGPSGSGKSTLLKSVCGFRKANKGTVNINGTDLYKNFSKFRSSIGYVPQDDIIHKDLSIYKTLKYSAQLRLPNITKSELEAKITQLLKMLEIYERKNVKVKKLSGGQRKRVSIAVELLTSPKIMLLDEPTSGLDPALETKMMSILKGLANEERTIMVSTHIMKSINYLDLIIVIVSGKLAFVGKPTEILNYFACDDYSDIFHTLTKKSATEWKNKFTNSNLYNTFITNRFSQPILKNDFIEKKTIVVNNKSKPLKKIKKDNSNNIDLDDMQAELERLKKELGNN